MNAKERILAERKRQIEVEGYSLEDDDKYVNEELLNAGLAYSNYYYKLWPWNAESWKPSTRIRNLEKAGALFTAENSRLKRLEEKTKIYQYRKEIEDLINGIEKLLEEELNK